ncbi:hypothetical protein DFJ73DRAFT_956941 [Zopfochytrium polystomum]|nr:hypothetical protein DFJ73DRAFT_956941 [Zopfochytrium polystomum]
MFKGLHLMGLQSKDVYCTSAVAWVPETCQSGNRGRSRAAAGSAIELLYNMAALGPPFSANSPSVQSAASTTAAVESAISMGAHHPVVPSPSENNNYIVNVPSAQSPPPQPLFELLHISNRITFENVYLNGIHALRRLEISNLCAFDLLIKLRSNLGSQIAFQLSNENLPPAGDSGVHPSVLSAPIFDSLVKGEAIPGGGGRELTSSQLVSLRKFSENGYGYLRSQEYNQLFNYVNHIDQLVIPAGKVESVVLAFLPESRDRNRVKAAEMPLKESEMLRIGDDAKDFLDDDMHDFFEVNGQLFFFAFRQDALVSGSDTVEVLNPLSQLSIKFRSRVCQSVLFADISETGIIFDGCIVGGKYFRDFSVWNRSEIELMWTLTLLDASNTSVGSWLEFTNYDTGEPLVDGQPVPSYSQIRVRVAFKPQETGDFNFEIQLENLNDAENTVRVAVQAIVTSAPREELLLINNGSPSMDFGDCCAGQNYRKALTLRNLSESILDVSFTAENANLLVFFKSDQSSSKDRPSNVNGPNSTADPDGERGVVERVKDLESLTGSEVSNPSSTLNSRASSPTSLNRKEPDTEIISTADVLEFLRPPDIQGADEAPDRMWDRQDVLGTDFVQIEELVLLAGHERSVEVVYFPGKDALTSDYRGGRLAKKQFKLIVNHSKRGQSQMERKIVQCRARTCTSFVEVSPSLVNFGDTDVGTLKSAPIQISNMSDLAASVEFRFISKVLHCSKGEISIPPKQTVEVKLDIYPRKVNPDYCKQITLVNLRNRENDQIVEVRSTHIDKNRVTFHSLFYRIITPSQTNFIDFGMAVINSQVVRTVTLENISKRPLRLGLTSSMPDEITIFQKSSAVNPRSESQSSAVAHRKERLLESIGDRRTTKRVQDDSSSAAQKNTSVSSSHSTPKLRNEAEEREVVTEHSAYLDLASSSALSSRDSRKSPRRRAQIYNNSGHYRQLGADDERRVSDVGGIGLHPVSNNHFKAPTKRLMSGDSSEAAQVNIDSLVSTLEQSSGLSPPLFSKPVAEEKFVKAQIVLRREFENSVRSGKLVTVNTLELVEGQSVQLILVLTPNSSLRPTIQVSRTSLAKAYTLETLQSKPRKHDAKIFIRLVDFDRQIDQPQFEQLLLGSDALIPVRELMIRCSLCRSVMELGQRNINFGFLDKNEARTKTIVIRNKSEIPLLYSIKKSGSIASGDLIIVEGRNGLVRGYGQKEIEFVFDPSLAGPFNERLVIENVQDKDNDHALTIKALIRQPSKFSVDTASIDFGIINVNQLVKSAEALIVSNTTKQARTMEVRLDPSQSPSDLFVVSIFFEVGVDESSGVEGENASKRKQVLLSKDMEEKIEALEQKLKIAERKGRKDKAEKILTKLANLRLGKLDSKVGTESESLNERKAPLGMEAEDQRIERGLDDPKAFASPESEGACRASENYLSFTIPPHSISTVSMSIFIRAAYLESSTSTSQKPESLLVSGSLLVNELKNKDVVKSVPFYSSLNLEYEIPTKSSTIFGNRNEVPLENVTLSNSGQQLAHPPIPVDRGIGMATTDFIPRRTETLVSSAPASESAGQDIDIEIELTSIDLKRAEINDSKDVYFTATNPFDFDCSLQIVPPVHPSIFRFLNYVEAFQPKETKRIYLKIEPETIGRQSHTFAVQLRHRQVQIAFSFYGVRKTYFAFPYLSGHHGVNPEIDIGPTFLNSTAKYSRVIQFPVVNISEDAVLLVPSSNLSLQCFLFADPELETVASSILIKPKETASLYVAIQPSQNPFIASQNSKVRNSSSGAGLVGPSESERQSISNTRYLIGGLKFTAFTMPDVNEDRRDAFNIPVEGAFLLQTQLVKFKTLVGTSLFATSDTVIDFGRVESLGQFFQGSISITNLTPKFPLEVTAQAESTFIQLPASSISMPSTEEAEVLEPSDSDRQPKVSAQKGQSISFTLSGYDWGYCCDRIFLRNVNNPNQVATIEVRLFADVQHLKVQQAGCADADELPGSIVSIRWDEVNVIRRTDGFFQIARSFGDPNGQALPMALERCLLVENMTEELLRIQADCNIPLSVRWFISGESGFVIEGKSDSESKRDATSQSSFFPQALLHPHQKASLFIDVPEPAITDEFATQIRSGLKFPQNGRLAIRNCETGFALQIVDILAFYVLSKGEVTPNFISLGQVGYFGNWRNVAFTFQIRCLSDVPMAYQIACPDEVEVAEILDNTGEVVSKCEISAWQYHTVRASLSPRSLKKEQAGPCVSVLLVKNLFNADNVSTIEIKSDLSLPDLRFERISDQELTLPPLEYPPLQSTAQSDNWFSITSVSEREARFDMYFKIDPILADFIRVEVLSRLSNSPVLGANTIPPSGRLEVRVRAFFLEQSRLSKQHQYLMDGAGVRFGTLHILPKNSSASADGSLDDVVESILVRGSIAEVSSFTISTKVIQFRCIPPLDFDEAPTPSTMTRRNMKQSDVVTITNLSRIFPLKFSVRTEYPLELIGSDDLIAVGPLDEGGFGLVPAGAQLTLNVDLSHSGLTGVSEDIKLSIFDANAIRSTTQTVFVKITEDTDGVLASAEALSEAADSLSEYDSSELAPKSELGTRSDDARVGEDMESLTSDGFSANSLSLRSNLLDSQQRRALPCLIHLRGCKRPQDQSHVSNYSDFGGLFELDLGPQDLSNNCVTRKLLLENGGIDRVAYRVRTLIESDSSWVTLSRSDGVLDPIKALPGGTGVQRDSHALTLSFMATSRGVYSTYIIVENIDNPADTKTIRTTMEVVIRHNIRRPLPSSGMGSATSSTPPVFDSSAAKMFDVVVNGLAHSKDSLTDTIMMENLYYDVEYSARSFVIYNYDSASLEFVVKSNLRHDDRTELIFSLSRTSAKIFRSVTVDAESQKRIFIFFRPAPPQNETLERTLSWASQVEEKTIEIYVNCRVVKDFQKTIFLRAHCRHPQIALDNQSCLFKANLLFSKDSADPPTVTWSPSYIDVRVENLLQDPLDYYVMNDSAYFHVEPLGDEAELNRREFDKSLGAYGSQCLRISPNIEAIQKNVENIRREKYLLEFINVHNLKRQSEKWRIMIKFSCGRLAEFQSASGYRYSFRVLEDKIIKLLRDLQSTSRTTVENPNSDSPSSIQFTLYSHVVDDLIHFATREQAGENYLQLACLLFTGLFQSSVFGKDSTKAGSAPGRGVPFPDGRLPAYAEKWVALLLYFLSFFPMRSHSVESMRALSRDLLPAGGG